MRPDRLALIAFVGFVGIAGAVPVAIRMGSFELPSFWAAGFRYGIAAVILAGVAIAWRVPFPRGAQLAGPVLFAVLFFGGYAPLFYLGLSQAPAAVGSIVGAFQPLVTLLLAATVGLERFTFRAVAGALVAIVGIGVVVGDQLLEAIPPLALAELVVATVLSAAAIVVIKRLPLSHPTTASAVVTAVGAPILLALSVAVNERWALPVAIDTWVSFAFLVLAGTVVLFQLGYFVIQRWTATAFSYTGLLTPLGTVAVAAIVLAEPISAFTLLGGVLILGGTWLGAFSAPPIPPPIPVPVDA
jgi:drug/metabolite transporter (DMT)-like permease